MVHCTCKAWCEEIEPRANWEFCFSFYLLMVQMEPKWLVVLVVILGLNWLAETQEGLKTGFYSSSCPKAEAIVRSTVESHFNKDPTIAAGVLRLHFHDCFVQVLHLLLPCLLILIDHGPLVNWSEQGCDGSVLITGASSERNALPNLGLRGFDVIDDAKTQLEASCPGVVSCADILALAARDAVDLVNCSSSYIYIYI